VQAGEALGFAGLLGSGRSELARLLFGADRPDRGRVEAGGSILRRGSVPDAVMHGLGFTPEDRKAQGLILELSVAENIMLALQAQRGSLHPIRRAERARLTSYYIKALGIKTPSAQTPVGSLSGGNQQKVLLARWLAAQPKVLILDEPARGIDVGARAEIESLIRDLKAQGLAVVLVSAELDELARMCDRVLVLRDRRGAGELIGPDVNEAAMLRMIAQPSSGEPAAEAGA
jgi:simple sugar transport system ATP-binding protein